ATAVTTADRSTYANDAAYIAAQSASFGDLYQWGRCADGHEIRTSSLAVKNATATTAVPSQGNAWDGKFIPVNTGTYDWLATADDNLWQGVSGTNNPCPAGYRLPTKAELQDLDGSFIPNTSVGAYASPVKMPVAGYRNDFTGSLESGGGNYWSSSVSGSRVSKLYFTSGVSSFSTSFRAYGYSVRCLKD
ncbi:MAG: hypothetical protein GY746_15780, partial [Gammaproteobacteria bacterium]|nr:hypothetical protein [Gammaproteobacteria bacterium]